MHSGNDVHFTEMYGKNEENIKNLGGVYMKKKLFGNNIKPSCKYCELGTAMGDDKIQCSKFGVVKSYDSCKKFVYSPLKRIPKKEIQLANSDVNNINF